MNRVELTEHAIEDLVQIHAAIALQSPQNADAVVMRLRALIASLDQFPRRGRARTDIAKGLRAIGIDSHVVFYTVRARRVVIVRVLHGSRDHRTAFQD